jgi:starch-binding outer membrane protein, SusD/RagB family
VPGISGMNGALADRILGEAYFLRALYYFYLVRTYGNVPLITAETTDLKSIYVKADPVDKVYEQIIADLKMAESKLPPSTTYSAINKGRAAKGSAQTLLGKVYLTRKNWTEAKAALLNVVNSNQYALFTDFQDNFKEATENGIEHIYSMQFSDVPGAGQAQIADYFAPRFSGLGDRNGGWGSFVSEKKFYENFPRDDYRFRATFLPDTIGSDGKVLGYPGKGLSFPHVWKWMIKEKGNNGRGLNVTVLRYADVLLMLAEAENELNGPTEQAYTALNQVRARARGKSKTPADYVQGSLTKDTFREVVFREREIELAFENHSWFDLKRTGKLIDVMRNQEKAAIQEKHLLFPIPQLELDNNPSLTQNPGW